MPFDAAIIGAGPAGSTLARLLSRSLRVLLIDRRSVGRSDDAGKCCGGLLAPDAQKMLSTLGLGLPKSVLDEPQLFVVKAIDLEQGLERNYQRHYINMDRRGFDAWLLSLVPASVDIRTGCRLADVEKTSDGRFSLRLSEGRSTCVESARIVIGADGAHSLVRRKLFAEKPFPRAYFAVQEWFERTDDSAYFTSIFDREVTDYYCWTIPKGDRLALGAAIFPARDAVAKFELLKKKLADRGWRLGPAIRREGALLLRPTNNRLAGDGAALVGEAAGLISPSSAEGLSHAMRSAMRLAESLRNGLDLFERRYRAAMRGQQAVIAMKNLKSPFIFRPMLRRAVMRSGVGGMEIHDGRNNSTSE